MARFLTTPANFHRVAIFAASALVALSSSCVGHASCGEYVHSRFRTPSDHTSMPIWRVEGNRLGVAKSEAAISPISVLPTEIIGAESQPLAPARCHGPNCSQNPVPIVPVAPQIVIGNSIQDLLVFGHSSDELPSEVSRHRDLKSNARSRRGYPLLIEMPPDFSG